MGFFLRVFYADQVREADLDETPALTIGGGKKSDVLIPIPGFKIKTSVKVTNIGVSAKASADVQIGGTAAKKGLLAPNDSCVISRSPLVALTLYEKVKDSPKTVDFSKVSSVTIGRNPENNIRLKSGKVSGNHAKIEKIGGVLTLTDDSTNGTYVNGTRIKEHTLQSGDVIFIAGYRLIFNNNILFFRNVGCDLTLTPAKPPEEPAERGYPYFQVSPRLNRQLPSGEVEIQPPPNIGAKPEISWLSVLLPPVALVAVMGGVAYMTRNMATLLYTAPMTLIGIVVSIVNYTGQRKKHRKAATARARKYTEHLEAVRAELSEKRDAQKEILTAVHPAPADCLTIAREREGRLWERRPSEQDFMTLKLGLGETPFRVTVKIPKVGISIEEDALASEPEKIAKQYQTVSGVPVCVDLKSHPLVGVIGNRSDVILTAKNLLVQLAAHHSYEEVKIITLYNKTEAAEWSWCRWLPHAWDDSRAARYIADDKASASSLLKEFAETIKQRENELKEESNREKRAALPFLLFVITDKAFIENETIMRYLTRNDTALGIGALLLFDEHTNIEVEAEKLLLVHAENEMGAVYPASNVSDAKKFSIENISNQQLDAFARDLAPIRIKSSVSDSRLPNCVTFLQGYRVKKAEELNIGAYWESAAPHKNLTVPIAARENGDAFLFNILWGGGVDFHGPHGLVAGTTRSGKSELVQTWILSMAVRFSPKDVSFVLIDWKGTSLISPFRTLPHIAGTISNIDKNTRRNFIALERELHRRQTLFDQYAVNDIKAYKQLYSVGKTEEPLSYLILVIDEFAEVRKEIPEFIPALDSIFAKGASLGVFAVIATQEPNSVVTDKMLANTRFRWCLKVSGPQQSREMIGRPDASKITVPGRGYIKIGDNEIFESVQSYWSGAPYNPNAKAETVSSVKITTVDLGGTRHKCESLEKTAGFTAEKNEIDAVVQQIAAYAKENNLEKARAVWAPPLKELLPLSEVLDEREIFNGAAWQNRSDGLRPAIGLLDDPMTQAQEPFRPDITEDGNIVVFGAPQTGKTTLLQTLALSLALSYSPDEVNIYAMDFGSWELSPLAALPHAGGVALGSEDEKIRSLSRLLLNILAQRRQGFTEHGVNGIAAYSKAIGKPVPYIVLLLDDFAPVPEQYPDLTPFFTTLVRSGGGYGMFLVATATAISGVHYQIRQNIKQTIALQMIDKTDYMEIVGRVESDLAKIMGRGLIRGN
ncbi:MAG: type VII secretion protein EssC, partial [Clostridiales bacterium]|nr:type VII secretion protein EssC [Clostridiales bacterium]